MTYGLSMRWGRRVGRVACVCLLAAGCGGGGGTDAASTTVAVVTSSTLPPESTLPPVSDTTPTSIDPAAVASSLPPATDPPVEPVPAEPDAIQPPAAGTYTYANAGETRVTGCTVLKEPAPPTSTVVYEAPAGSRQRSVSDQGQGGRNTTVLEYRADGVYLVQLKQETQAFTADFQPADPVLVAPRAATVGQVIHFVLTSTDGQLTADTTITVQAVGEAASLGDGTGVPVTRMLRAAHLTGHVALGNVDIQTDVVDSIAMDLRLSAHSVSDTNGTIGLCKIASHVESTLQSGTPA